MGRIAVVLTALSLFVMAGCATRGERVSPDVEAVATHDFNPTDLQIIGKKSVDDLLSKAEFPAGKKPMVYVAPVRNVTNEHINLEMIREYISGELQDSGKVRQSGVSKEMAEATKQLEFQQGGSVDPETARKIGKMIGAEYFIQGELANMESKAGRKKGQYFLFSLTLVNIETLEVWKATPVEIQKLSKKGLFGW